MYAGLGGAAALVAAVGVVLGRKVYAARQLARQQAVFRQDEELTAALPSFNMAAL